uniref:Receptor binding complex n=1 Tax=Dulem virus 42 TaxID=3145760 RepID=A0AAU8B8U5_9CAUD
MSPADKIKLDSLDETYASIDSAITALNNVQSTDGITIEAEANGTVTNTITLPLATSVYVGLMSGADKAKLDSLDSTVYASKDDVDALIEGIEQIGYVHSPYDVNTTASTVSLAFDTFGLSSITHQPVTGTNSIVISAATSTNAGVMSAADKSKLDSIGDNIPDLTVIDVEDYLTTGSSMPNADIYRIGGVPAQVVQTTYGPSIDDKELYIASRSYNEAGIVFDTLYRFYGKTTTTWTWDGLTHDTSSSSYVKFFQYSIERNNFNVSTTATNATLTIADNTGSTNKVISTTLPVATTSAAGLMSASDKNKLDSLDGGDSDFTEAMYEMMLGGVIQNVHDPTLNTS